MSSERFTIVMPVYEDAQSVRHLFRELAALFGKTAYVVAVDDGSIREPVDSKWLSEYGLDGVVITLAQNVGHQKAIAVGMCYAAEHLPGQAVVTMDSDGEDRPQTIMQLLNHLGPQVEVAAATRKSRIETLKFKLFYVFYKHIFKLLSGRVISFGNFAAYSPQAVARLSKMAGLWIHIAGTVLSSKLRIHHEPIDRGARYAGTSKMNFVGLALHGFRSLMVFAEDVLVRVGIFCGIMTAFTVLGLCTAVFLKLIGLSSPGWFSVIIGVFLLMMMQTGILTLTTLLLTGVMKGVLNVPPDYRFFVKEIRHA